MARSSCSPPRSKSFTGTPALAKFIAMPLPMVPAPITAPSRMSRVAMSLPMPGTRAICRSAKKRWRNAAASGERTCASKTSYSLARPLVEGELHRRLHALDARVGRAHAAGAALDLLAHRIEDPGIVEPDLAVAHPRVGTAAGGTLGREVDRLVEEILLHRPVHEPQSGRLRAGYGRSAQDHLERFRRTHQARQALRAARPGRHADLHLGLAEAGIRGAHAVVAGHRELEPAAEGVAVDGRDHRLRAGFAFVNRIAEVGLALRPGAQALDVRAGDEGAPAARQHQRRHVRVGRGRGQRFHDAARHSDAEGVHRRVVDEDEAHAVAFFVLHKGHRCSLQKVVHALGST